MIGHRNEWRMVVHTAFSSKWPYFPPCDFINSPISVRAIVRHYCDDDDAALLWSAVVNWKLQQQTPTHTSFLILIKFSTLQMRYQLMTSILWRSFSFPSWWRSKDCYEQTNERDSTCLWMNLLGFSSPTLHKSGPAGPSCPDRNSSIHIPLERCRIYTWFHNLLFCIETHKICRSLPEPARSIIAWLSARANLMSKSIHAHFLH